MELVRTYIEDLEKFGQTAFETRSGEVRTHGGTGRPTEYAVLNEHQATLIMTYMRNTEVIRKFKIRLVTAFYEMAEELRQQAKQIATPQSLPEALRLAADLAEKNMQLAEAAEKARPKVAFHDAVRSCPDTMEIGRFAKILGSVTMAGLMPRWRLRGLGMFQLSGFAYQTPNPT